jgi:hypothetical protein
VIGASRFAARFPRISIARDAFAEIFNSPVFALKAAHSKLFLALSCGAGVLISYYGREFPFIIGGMIKRLFTRPFAPRSSARPI